MSALLLWALLFLPLSFGSHVLPDTLRGRTTLHVYPDTQRATVAYDSGARFGRKSHTHRTHFADLRVNLTSQAGGSTSAFVRNPYYRENQDFELGRLTVTFPGEVTPDKVTVERQVGNTWLVELTVSSVDVVSVAEARDTSARRVLSDVLDREVSVGYIVGGDDKPSWSHFDLVFVAEGWMFEAEFVESCTAATDYMFTLSPYLETKEYWNVRYFFLPAEENEWPFGSASVASYDSDILWGTLEAYMDPNELDNIVLWRNDTAYNGRAPGVVSIINGNPTASADMWGLEGRNVDEVLGGMVLAHELGHSLGLLTDEYSSSAPQCETDSDCTDEDLGTCDLVKGTCTKGYCSRAAINTAANIWDDSTGAPWDHWIEAGAEGVGYFPQDPVEWECSRPNFIPTENSYMNNIFPTEDFGPVNREQLVLQLFEFVYLIDSYSPHQENFYLEQGETVVLSVTLSEASQPVCWYKVTEDGSERLLTCGYTHSTGLVSEYVFVENGETNLRIEARVQTSDQQGGQYVLKDEDNLLQDIVTWYFNWECIHVEGTGSEQLDGEWYMHPLQTQSVLFMSDRAVLGELKYTKDYVVDYDIGYFTWFSFRIVYDDYLEETWGITDEIQQPFGGKRIISRSGASDILDATNWYMDSPEFAELDVRVTSCQDVTSTQPTQAPSVPPTTQPTSTPQTCSKVQRRTSSCSWFPECPSTFTAVSTSWCSYLGQREKTCHREVFWTCAASDTCGRKRGRCDSATEPHSNGAERRHLERKL